MTTFLVFIGTILLLVMVHEGGHFLAAKALRIAVEEFAIGFGPALWSWKRRETRYSLRAFPIGGYVRLAGESGETAEVPFERTYYGRPAWARFLLSFSGPLANGALAVAVVLGAILGLGLPRLRVAGLVPGKPAAEALAVGDVILAVGGRSVWATDELGKEIQAIAPAPVAFRIRRDRRVWEVALAPVYSERDGRYLVGAYFYPQVYLAEIADLRVESPLGQAGFKVGDRVVAACGRPVGSLLELYASWEEGCRAATVDRAGALVPLALPEVPPADFFSGAGFRTLPIVYERPSAWEGIARAFREIGRVLTGFLAVIRGLLARTLPPGEAVTGPVGIAAVLGQGVQAGPVVLLFLVALISLNLALFNLIPFPALDGARMAFALYEMAIRRKVSPRVETAIHAAGFVLLLGLLLLITFQDVMRFFR